MLTQTSLSVLWLNSHYAATLLKLRYQMTTGP